MQAKSYVWLFFALSLFGFSGAAAFNYVVDPYRFFDSADRAGINEYRRKFFFGQYVSKPYALREHAPEAVILGVSRAGSSLATDHPGWRNTRVYNYAMAGSSAYLLWRNYQHARASGDLRKVVLMLDFYMFNVHKEQRPALGHTRGYEERLAVNEAFAPNRGYPVRWFKDTVSSLLSFEMFYESWETIIAQAKIAKQEDYRATLTPSGFWINDPHPQRTQRRLFRVIEEQYVTITWFPRPEQRFSLVREDGSDNLIYLRRIIADAHREGIDLRLGFMPFHARLAEALRAVELWDDFEQWKRQVVTLVEEEAAQLGEAPYPLWDFTGYNSITTEPVPARADRSTRMRWHLDGSHVSRATGDLIQTRMLDTQGERVADFGEQVNSASIDAYIERTQVQRERYAREFAKDIKEVREKVNKTESWRRRA